MAVPSSQIARTHEMAKRCDTSLQVVKEEASVLPSAIILTFIHDNGWIETFAQAQSAPRDLIARINDNSLDPRREIERIRNTPAFSVSQEPLLPYFSAENLKDRLRQDEQLLLEDAGYDVDTDFYFAFPFPTGSAPKGICFLFAHAGEEAERINAARENIQNRIKNEVWG